MKTLAIDIGGTSFRIAAFDRTSLLRRESFMTDRAGGRDRLLEDLRPAIRKWNAEIGFERCGIGFGGPVLWDRQIVAKSTHAGGWGDFNFPGWVREQIGPVPVAMDNDANVGAIGEYVFGGGRGCSPLLYMTVSTGIGGGILVDGRVLRGADSWAGEIGHINVRPDGPECLCGSNGCLERMCCGLWLERDYGASARDLMQKPEFVATYVVDLARGIKAAIMLLNPQRVIIGGGIANAGMALFGPLRAELARQMPPWSKARVDVIPAACGGDSVLCGALALVSDRFVSTTKVPK